MCVAGSLNFAEVVMLDLACATGRAVRLSGPILTLETMRLSNQLLNQGVKEHVPIRDLKTYDASTNQPTNNDDCMYLIPYIGCF